MTRKYLGYDLTENLIYLIECLKVEGYWSLKNYECSIQNKNLPFLRHIEKLLSFSSYSNSYLGNLFFTYGLFNDKLILVRRFQYFFLLFFSIAHIFIPSLRILKQ